MITVTIEGTRQGEGKTTLALLIRDAVAKHEWLSRKAVLITDSEDRRPAPPPDGTDIHISVKPPLMAGDDGKAFHHIALERAGYEVVPRMPDIYSCTVRKGGKDIAHYWPGKQWWNLTVPVPNGTNNGRGLEALISRLQAVAP